MKKGRRRKRRNRSDVGCRRIDQSRETIQDGRPGVCAFEDKIIGAEFNCLWSNNGGISSGEHDDGDGGQCGLLADAAENFQPVDFGQVIVKKDDFGLGNFKNGEGLVAVRNAGGGVAAVADQADKGCAGVVMVVDNQDVKMRFVWGNAGQESGTGRIRI